MKIAYISFLDAYRYTGVLEKISHQINAMKKSGHDAGLYLISPRGNKKVVECVLIPRVLFKNRILEVISKIIALRKLRVEISRFNPDLIYFRENSYIPGIVPVFKIARKVCIEVNTDNHYEKNLFQNLFYFWLYKKTEGLLFKQIDLIVCVTHELAEIEEKRKKKKAIAISNGISCNTIPFVQKVPANENIVVGYMISSNGIWHGLDKVVALAGDTLFSEFEFRIIGFSKDQLEMELKRKLPNNVKCRGYLGKTEIQNELSKLDIALGTCGLHRKNMSEASPLKVRHYLANGVPVILPYKDTDFIDISEQEFGFVLELPNSENNLFENKKTIYEYCHRVKGDVQLRRRAREFAENNFSYERKLDKIIAELNNC